MTTEVFERGNRRDENHHGQCLQSCRYFPAPRNSIGVTSPRYCRQTAKLCRPSVAWNVWSILLAVSVLSSCCDRANAPSCLPHAM